MRTKTTTPRRPLSRTYATLYRNHLGDLAPATDNDLSELVLEVAMHEEVDAQSEAGFETVLQGIRRNARHQARQSRKEQSEHLLAIEYLKALAVLTEMSHDDVIAKLEQDHPRKSPATIHGGAQLGRAIANLLKERFAAESQK